MRHQPPHCQTPIRLNVGFRSDLAWWQTFLVQWNGVSFLLPPSHLPRAEVTTDASGSWGAGAWHQSAWFQIQWDHRSQDLSIAAKELIPIIMACHVWGKLWAGHQVICHCDNQVVVACLRSKTSKDTFLMHLLRCLVFTEAHYSCYLLPTYICTKANHLADDLSRNNAFSFLSKVPQANPSPTPVSLQLLDLLLDPRADWTSPSWGLLFNSTSRQA